MHRLILVASAAIALTACQGQVPGETAADSASDVEAGADSASDAGTDASADAAGRATGGASAGAASAAPRDIAPPPQINGDSDVAPVDSGTPARRTDGSPLTYGSRPPERPTTENLARPDTVMPDTTPDGRPAI